MIRNVRSHDAKDICGIYNYYIKNTVITFEEDEIDTKEIETRVAFIIKKYPWLVFEDKGKIKGYAYASGWKSRPAYRYSVESTVYVDIDHTGKGIGIKLLEALIEALKNRGFHRVMGGIALPNDASIALHEKFGFLKCAHFSEVGFKFGKWIDVGYWQKIL
ncbi:MAG: arsinothricin resistance N-acetyltransferase ArsN1 family B [Ignavibacteria bacterium]